MTFIKKIIPSKLLLSFRYFYAYCKGTLELELKYLHRILPNKCNTAIDIGANLGLYTYKLSKYFKKVIAFEPQRSCCKVIEDSRLSNVVVYNKGLSDKNTTLNLFIPLTENGDSNIYLASFKNVSENNAQMEVPVIKLDELGITDIDFIKIDVEGYECEVLDGSIKTIEREKPVLLIEIEQRHHKEETIEEIFQKIKELGYNGFFLNSKLEMLPICEFDPVYNQNCAIAKSNSKQYINNFLFLPL